MYLLVNVVTCKSKAGNELVQIYIIAVLPVTCRCGTRAVTLTEEQGLGVVDSRVLRKAIRPKRDEATVEWSRLSMGQLQEH